MNESPVARRLFDSIQQEAYLNLWRTYDKLRALEDRLFDQHELTAQQYNVLRLLKAAHPATIPTLTLASRLISRAPDITRMLDRLAKRGLIVRARGEHNRRFVEVGITEQGIQLLRELQAAVLECHQTQLGHMEPAALEHLCGLLREARAPHEAEESTWRK